MTNRDAPASALLDAGSTVTPKAAAAGPGMSYAELARLHGMTLSGIRPGVVQYTRTLWAQRHFITALAGARLAAMYTNARLGQVWQLVTPLVNAGVYFLVFGMLLGAQETVQNYPAYLCVGIFTFTFTQQTVQAATRSIPDNLGLIRAIKFPRATLPISATLIQLQQLLISMAVLGLIVLGTGEPVTVRWLLIAPIIALQTVFTAGLALVVARISARTTDLAQVMPFILRTWMYGSGIFYDLSHVISRVSTPTAILLQANPALVYIDLMRYALIESSPASPQLWWLAIGWAIVLGVGGYLFFWRS
jgi:teichoic acid transport system permease protein